MRRLALLGFVLLLPGCTGFLDFVGNTMTYGTNPNAPVGDSENMRRARGLDASIEPIVPEPGNIWPTTAAPMPTLQDYEKGGFQPPPSGVPFAPDHREPTPEGLPPGPPPRGSSTPPPNVQPGPAQPEEVKPPSISTAPPPPSQSGQSVQLRRGTGTISGGTSGYQTLSTPQGPAVIVPNGNGTSTVIHSDGSIETIPTPR